MIFETWLTSDLKKPLRVAELKGNLFSDDNGGNRIGVEVLDDGEPATLSGGVVGYIIRADGATIMVNGTAENNRAYIDLPASAYVVIGQVSIAIKVGSTTVGACAGYVYPTTTDSLVDPGHVIPSIEELLEKIADCEAATKAAMKVANMTVSAVEASGVPTVTLTETGSGASAHKHLTFGLVPGVSPVVTVVPVTGGYQVTITDGSGDHPFNILHGTSTSVTVTPITGGHKVVITDNEGNHEFNVMHGTSTTVVVSAITGGHKVIITDAEGNHEFNVMDGANGTHAWIRYAAVQPTQDSDMKTTPDEWIGIYCGPSTTAPTAYTAYTWYKFKGETGRVENVYANTVPMSSTDSRKISEVLDLKVDEDDFETLADAVDLKADTVSLLAEDDTWAKVWEKLDAMPLQSVANFYCWASAFSILSGGARENTCYGTISRRSATQFVLNFHLHSKDLLTATIDGADSTTSGTYAERLFTQAIILFDTDDTWAKVWAKLDDLQTNYPASFFCNHQAATVLSDGLINNTLVGTIVRYSADTFLGQIRIGSSSNSIGSFYLTGASASSAGTFTLRSITSELDGKIDTSSIKNNHSTTDSGYVLDARQAVTLWDAIGERVVGKRQQKAFTGSSSQQSVRVDVPNGAYFVILQIPGINRSWVGLIYVAGDGTTTASQINTAQTGITVRINGANRFYIDFTYSSDSNIHMVSIPLRNSTNPTFH